MTKDELSKQIDVLQYLDLQGFMKAMTDNGARFRSEEAFKREMDVHLRIIFHRRSYRETTTELKLTNRASMGNEVKQLIVAPFYAYKDMVFMARDEILAVWPTGKYNPKREEPTPEIAEAIEAYDKAPRFSGVRMTKSEIKSAVPKSLRQRKEGRKTTRFTFAPVQVSYPGGDAEQCVITNLADDKSKAKIFEFDENSDTFGEGSLEVDTSVLADSLCWLGDRITVGVVFFGKSVGPIVYGPNLLLTDSNGITVVLHDRRSEKKEEKA